jgi:hypothetical protein
VARLLFSAADLTSASLFILRGVRFILAACGDRPYAWGSFNRRPRMKRNVMWVGAAMALLCSTAALAQDDESESSSDSITSEELPSSSGWSVSSGKTIGRGNKAIHGQLGWPGLSGTFLLGINDKLDVGGRLAFNYGLEGAFAIVPGFKLQGVVRLNFVETSQINFGISLEPGFYWYGFNFYSLLGIALPVSANLGIRASSALMVNVGVDVPMSIAFFSGAYPGYSFYPYYYTGSSAVLFLPIQMGGGVEYSVNQQLAITYNLRIGPFISSAGGYVTIAMNALMGVAYRF